MRPADRTSQTDDERIKDITVLPPPEHLIRFFPIGGTAVESLIGQTRQRIHDILHGEDKRLLVIIGPCSIADRESNRMSTNMAQGFGIPSLHTGVCLGACTRPATRDFPV
jgi:3-deoxy-D-arabino-heptulosonate 7-phosphate (DAHP) synthase